MIQDALLAEAEALLAACRAKGIVLATAEGCTGGLIAATLTAIPGASDVLDRGYVPYSNAALHETLGVPMALIEEHGAVSEPVARAMAEGALTRSCASLAIAVTGIAGPGGGTADKPAGTICFGIAQKGIAQKDGAAASERCVLAGDRAGIRAAAVAHAFAMIRARL